MLVSGPTTRLVMEVHVSLAQAVSVMPPPVTSILDAQPTDTVPARP
jgi:hypothetical protein